MKKIIVAILAASSMTGCTMFGLGSVGEDSFMMAGSPEAIRAYMDGQSGLITNARTQDPEGNSAHWRFRTEQEVQRTQRKCSKCGFFQKLFGGGQQQAPVK